MTSPFTSKDIVPPLLGRLPKPSGDPRLPVITAQPDPTHVHVRLNHARQSHDSPGLLSTIQRSLTLNWGFVVVFSISLKISSKISPLHHTKKLCNLNKDLLLPVTWHLRNCLHLHLHSPPFTSRRLRGPRPSIRLVI